MKLLKIEIISHFFLFSFSYSLPRIFFNDLFTSSEISLDISRYFHQFGGIEILQISSYKESKEEALKDLSRCLQDDNNNNNNNNNDIIQTIMNDKKIRRTIATSNTFENNCGKSSLKLRNIINSITSQVFYLLDKSYSNQTNQFIMKPYKSFQDIIKYGEHLEHLHSYYSNENSSSSSSSSSNYNDENKEINNLYTIPLHTDAGLFIAMTPGYYTKINQHNSEEIKPKNGLYIQLPSGEITEIITEEDSLIIIIGQGSADWISKSSQVSLRPLPHALMTNLPQGWTRSWYGKMFLPPKDAYLPEINGFIENYGDYRIKELEYSKQLNNNNDNIQTLPSACGRSLLTTTTKTTTTNSNQFTKMIQNTLCNNGNGVYCWQQCYPLSDYPCGKEAECIDTATGKPVDGTIMCPSSAGMGACEVQCQNVNSSKDDYCWGPGVSMYMDGFTSIISSKKGSVACLNLFFKDWTLDKSYKYTLACIGVLLLGIVVECLSAVRRRIYSDFRNTPLRHGILILLHLSQTCLSYFLMLAAMTYNVEIFLMVMIGVGIGHGLFNLHTFPNGKNEVYQQLNPVEDIDEKFEESKAYGTYKRL